MSSSIFKKSDDKNKDKPVRSLDRILNNVSDPVQPNISNMQNIQNAMTGGAATSVIQDKPVPVFIKPVIPSILETETIETMLNKIEADLFGTEHHESHNSHDSHESQNTNTSRDLYSINNSSIKRVIA